MIANGTRVQFRLEPPEEWPATDQFPALQLGTISGVYKGGLHPEGTGRDLYVIDLEGFAVMTDERSFVVSTPQRTVVEKDDGLNDWHESPRPYDAALRIIADLHSAYGNNVGISVGRGAEDDIVTLHHPAVLGDAAMVDLTITFSVFGSAKIQWSGGKFDTDLGPNAYTLGIEAARVWLHEHGTKR